MPNSTAWLAGLGKALSGLGGDLEQRQMRQRQDALLADQQQRQQAQDALSRLVTLQSIGGTEMAPGTDPTQALAAAQQFNTLRSGGAVPNSAMGIPNESVPDAYGSPRTVSIPGLDGRPTTILMDPSKTPQAMQDRRMSMQQNRLDQREREKEGAITARADAAAQAKTLSGVKAARADYTTLKALNPKHPLVQSPPDADNAANYSDALKFEQQKQLQASAYHPPVSEGDWAPSGAIDPTTQEPILYNKKTGEKKALTGTVNKPGAGAAGQNAPQMAAAKANLESAMQIMDEYETKLKNKTADYGVIGGTEGALASSPAALNAKGLLGATDAFIANAASSRLQTHNPDLARYLTAKKYVAEAILNTHKRPNQTQYEIEQEISGAGPNASDAQIDMAADRRRRMKTEVFDNPAAGAVNSGRPAPSVPVSSAPQNPKGAKGGKDYGIFGKPPGGDEE